MCREFVPSPTQGAAKSREATIHTSTSTNGDESSIPFHEVVLIVCITVSLFNKRGAKQNQEDRDAPYNS
jgi:hypothetical protein